jgi:hypothetical protein
VFPLWKMEIRWENGWGGLGGYERIFLGDLNARISNPKIKKSVRIRPIRPIRSPIVSHCIPLYPQTIVREVFLKMFLSFFCQKIHCGAPYNIKMCQSIRPPTKMRFQNRIAIQQRLTMFLFRNAAC